MGMELAAADEAGLHDEAAESCFSDSEVAFHVRQALNSVILGDDESYNQLIEVIKFNDYGIPDQEAMLVASLRALAGSVSCLDVVRHEALLYSVFQMSMWHYGPNVMDAFVELLISMAASSGKFIDACLDALVSNFCPPNNLLNFLERPRGRLRKQQVLDRVHSALRDISDLVPLTPSRLEPIVRNRMPRLAAGEALSVIYVENMLRLESSELGEYVGRMMLKALVDGLVELDVEIVIEPISLEESSKGIFEMELEDNEEIDDGEEKIGHEVSRGTLNRQSLDNNQIADKLDSLIVITCEHLKSCADSGRLDEVYETLMESFEMTVMTAIKSKFSQFVLFYACSLDPENCGVKFAVRLADIFLDTGKVPDLRMVAVSYLASYLARGRFLPVSFVASILQRLVDWCHEYCHMRVGELNPIACRVFYSGCQDGFVGC